MIKQKLKRIKMKNDEFQRVNFVFQLKKKKKKGGEFQLKSQK